MMQVLCPLPSRSVLFSLEPIGIGTSEVESLESYLWRLARRHGVPAATLKEFVANQDRTEGFDPGPIRVDSPTRSANVFGQKLAVLTMQPAVARLGLGRLHDRLSVMHTLRTQRAWCPGCVADWRSGDPDCASMPLAWSLHGFAYCARHEMALVSNCPGCGRHFSSAKAWSPLAGNCPRCHADISLVREAPVVQQADVVLSTTYARFCEQSTDIPDPGDHPSGVHIDRAVQSAIRRHVVTSRRALAAAAGVAEVTLKRLEAMSASSPSLVVLARLSSACAVSMAGVLHWRLWNDEEPDDVHHLSGLPRVRQDRRDAFLKQDKERLRRDVLQVIEAGESPSLQGLAARFGMTSSTLSYLLGSSLRRLIVERAQRARRQRSERAFGEVLVRASKAYRELAVDGSVPSVRRVASVVGLSPSSTRLKAAYRLVSAPA
jgi:AraC-like DNA-binding protein